MGFVRNAQGWTDITHSVDSRIIFVDNTAGNDSNTFYLDGQGSWNTDVGPDPLNPIGTPSALQTLNAATNLVRGGYPDWILLKKGEIWTNQKFLNYSSKSGRSPSERTVIGAYGTGARPEVRPETGANQAVYIQNGINYLAIFGINFYAITRDPDSGQYVSIFNTDGITFYSVNAGEGGDSILIEDCIFRFFHNGLNIQDRVVPAISNLEIRRCLILDSVGNGHSQGIYLEGSNQCLIEQNLFDHCGWYGDRDTGGVTGALADIFKHGIYLQSGTNSGNITVRDNIIMRSSAHGMQIRPGGVVDGNLLVRNPLAILQGINELGQANVTSNNVILESNDVTTSLVRGMGIELKGNGVASATTNNNLFAHTISAQPFGYGIRIQTDVDEANNYIVNGNTFYSVDGDFQTVVTEPINNLTKDNNLWWDYPAVGTNRNIQDDGITLLDPTRNVDSYNALQGNIGTFDDFVVQVRLQSRDNWRTEYMADSINAWIKAGYVDVSGTSPISPTNLQVTVI